MINWHLENIQYFTKASFENIVRLFNILCDQPITVYPKSKKIWEQLPLSIKEQVAEFYLTAKYLKNNQLIRPTEEIHNKELEDFVQTNKIEAPLANMILELRCAL